jgi:hypothetical protein
MRDVSGAANVSDPPRLKRVVKSLRRVAVWMLAVLVTSIFGFAVV